MIKSNKNFLQFHENVKGRIPCFVDIYFVLVLRCCTFPLQTCLGVVDDVDWGGMEWQSTLWNEDEHETNTINLALCNSENLFSYYTRWFNRISDNQPSIQCWTFNIFIFLPRFLLLPDLTAGCYAMQPTTTQSHENAAIKNSVFLFGRRRVYENFPTLLCCWCTLLSALLSCRRERIYECSWIYERRRSNIEMKNCEGRKRWSVMVGSMRMFWELVWVREKKWMFSLYFYILPAKRSEWTIEK